jgi:teichuronic acid biosynthesis glycosyltransferase TuaH
VLTTVGVEYSLFSTASSAEAPERLRQIPSPRVGLVGNFNDRIDWNLLELCAERLPYVSIVLIGSLYHAGPGTRASFDKLIGHANVHAIGRLPHEQLPSAIAALDVGIIPYGMSPAVERINSLKFMQYLAAGKPVVTTPIPFLADRHVLARIESDPVRFVNAVREACLEAGDPTGADLRQRYARRHDWSEIAREQLEIYGAGLARSA